MSVPSLPLVPNTQQGSRHESKIRPHIPVLNNGQAKHGFIFGVRASAPPEALEAWDYRNQGSAPPLFLEGVRYRRDIEIQERLWSRDDPMMGLNLPIFRDATFVLFFQSSGGRLHLNSSPDMECRQMSWAVKAAACVGPIHPISSPSTG
ncbi:hypothetical protein FQN54_002837 [Arachnomyces sp. PD_36]|nr:hypothetical protein FQN54_002837 [Arachnomyces sp. PD_36]